MNNKPYWLQESGTDAIWYDKNFQNWKIGHESNLGSGSGARMLSYRGTGATALPQEATPWQYLKGTILILRQHIFGLFYTTPPTLSA